MTSATALASLRRLDEAEAEIGPAVEGATGDGVSGAGGARRAASEAGPRR